MQIAERLKPSVGERLKKFASGYEHSRRADASHHAFMMSFIVCALVGVVFWMAANQRAERATLRNNALVVVVGQNGQTLTGKFAEFTVRPVDVEFNAWAFRAVELIQGAGSRDVDTRFGYARRMMTQEEADRFEQGMGDDEVKREIRNAKVARYVNVDLSAGGVRQLQASDIVPAGLAPPDGIRERYDLLVTGDCVTQSLDDVRVRLSKRFAYWVRLMEIDSRTEEFPHGLVIERIEELRPQDARKKGEVNANQE